MVGTVPGLLEPHDDGWEAADVALRPFGLSTAVCHRIMSAAVAEAGKAPVRGSAIAAGVYGYQGGLAEMDLQLDEVGYKREDVLLQPFFASDDYGVTITPAGGNSYVGLPEQKSLVATKYRKGRVTAAALQRNTDPNQRSLVEIVPTDEMAAFERLGQGLAVDARLEWVSRFNVWMFLTHLDLKKREVRACLALPDRHVANKLVSKFVDQVIIPSYPLPQDVALPSNDGVDFDLPEIPDA